MGAVLTGASSYAPITSASAASSCQVARTDIDPDAYTRSDREKLWDQTREIAKTAADKMLKCARERQPGSDVFGGLERAADVPREKTDATFHVLVISDFDQADPDFRLSKYQLETQAQRDTAVEELVTGRGLPDLPHTTVYRVGFAMRGGKTNPERVEQMEQFWQQVLEKEVKVDVDDGYGA
ncbi:Lipoprotein OS=Streptomyces aurantiogriseus OX=66870 GN=GCM10010251_13090 PE=4 SV=1 [Streptomyces aurantiogriseus]